MKKLLALLLALCMVLPAFAFAEDAATADVEEEETDTVSAELYNKALGEFMELYAPGDAEVLDLGLRYARMAQAEAKLLESAVFLPTRAEGGNYAISSVVPYSKNDTLYGNDKDRLYTVIVATEPIKAEDRTALKMLWAEKHGTGEWIAAAKAFMAEKGYELQDEYNLANSADAQTWDVLATSKANDSEKIVNTYDGLYAFGTEGVQEPALALSHEMSEDGTVYTFKLREGAKWVDQQGREIAEVTADDFVAGMQHLLDAQGGLEALVSGLIVGVKEYLAGDKDFTKVGVKAVDTYTVEYTLTGRAPYFLSMLGYGCFAPMNRGFYESKGGKFGAEFDASAENYTYGIDPSNIAYCGPFLVENYTEKNIIKFAANPTYWNKDALNVHTLNWKFNDGQDVTKTYTDLKSGTLDGAGLNSSTLELARADGWFDQYAYTSTPTSTTFGFFFNLNRQSFATASDETKAISVQTEEDRTRAHAAINNVHFRRAVFMALDRATYSAQVLGEDVKYNSMRNSYTPGQFVLLPNEATIEINGESKTYPAGTAYGQIVQDQITADGVKLTVYKDGVENGSDTFDGWFSVENANEELKKAIEELAAEGVVIDADHPIYLDFPYWTGNEKYKNQGVVVQKCIEENLGGLVKVNLVDCATADDWYYTSYYCDYASEMNYDMSDVSGWGPDYGDPKTYLDTFIDVEGYCLKSLGLY